MAKSIAFNEIIFPEKNSVIEVKKKLIILKNVCKRI